MSASVDFQEAEYATERPLLEIKDLAIGFTTSNGEVNAVRNAHLTVMPGETVAIVGESGSGKSTTALAAHRPAPGQRAGRGRPDPVRWRGHLQRSAKSG